MIHATLPAGGSPADLLAKWNAFVRHHTDGLRFVTCALGILDARAQRNERAELANPEKQSRAHIVSDADRIARMKEDTVEADKTQRR